MVIANNFEFKIVSAGGKIPFQEYTKDGKTYVEVEPDAEYFVTLRKIKADSISHCCEFKVDGKGLGYYFHAKGSSTKKKRYGLYSSFKGRCFTTALKFVRSPFQTTTSHGSTMAGLGKIDLDVYAGISLGKRKRSDHISTITTSTIQRQNPKTIRSRKGSKIGSLVHSPLCEVFAPGKHLHRISLWYCSTPGLISVGILPKPPTWDVYGGLHHPLVKQEDPPMEEKEPDFAVSVSYNHRGSAVISIDEV